MGNAEISGNFSSQRRLFICSFLLLNLSFCFFNIFYTSDYNGSTSISVGYTMSILDWILCFFNDWLEYFDGCFFFNFFFDIVTCCFNKFFYTVMVVGWTPVFISWFLKLSIWFFLSINAFNIGVGVLQYRCS